MEAFMEFEAFFPRPPQLARNQRWHIFISYRSADRPWVLKLHDALRHLGYEVFVDQFVLNAGAALASSLDEGIVKSAAAIIVWSKNYSTSNWTKDEYNALKSRANSDQTFGLAVAAIDATELHPLLSGHIYTDFSQQPEGPSGEGLLRLLLGIMGKPLPEQAVKLATEIDTARKEQLVLIRAARQDDDPDRIIELAKSQEPAWTTSPILGCAAAEALIAAEKFDAANEILGRARGAFPEAVRPRQLEGLVARRRGDWQTAMRFFGAMYADDLRDPETVGMYAATWMSRYRESKNRLHLLRSRDLYREAFESSLDSYNGINAATKSLLLGEKETARQLAIRVESLFQEREPADYFEEATLAESRLLQADYAKARDLYSEAILMAPGETGSHKATLEQAQAIMDELATPQADRDGIELAFAHLKKAASTSVT
jgi:hypothetical protein